VTGPGWLSGGGGGSRTCPLAQLIGQAGRPRHAQPHPHPPLPPPVDAASAYKGAIYMVFDYAEHDLTGMIDSYRGKLNVAHVSALLAVGGGGGGGGGGGLWRRCLCFMDALVPRVWSPRAAACGLGAAAKRLWQHNGCSTAHPLAPRPCPPHQVKCIMMQLLRGLSYCHLNGVLHRDLKAANILITREG